LIRHAWESEGAGYEAETEGGEEVVTATELIAVAAKLAVPFSPSADCSSSDVAAALITPAGHVFTGVCVDTECGLGFCAEHAAIAEMLKARECQIKMIVAVDHRARHGALRAVPRADVASGRQQPRHGGGVGARAECHPGRPAAVALAMAYERHNYLSIEHCEF